MATKRKKTTKSEVEAARQEAETMKTLQRAGVDLDTVRETAQCYAVELDRLNTLAEEVQKCVPDELRDEYEGARLEVDQIRESLFNLLSIAFPRGGCAFQEAGRKFSLGKSTPTYEVDYRTMTPEDFDALEGLRVQGQPLVVRTLDATLVAVALEGPVGSEAREAVQSLIDDGVIVCKLRKPSLKAT